MHQRSLRYPGATCPLHFQGQSFAGLLLVTVGAGGDDKSYDFRLPLRLRWPPRRACRLTKMLWMPSCSCCFLHHRHHSPSYWNWNLSPSFSEKSTRPTCFVLFVDCCFSGRWQSLVVGVVRSSSVQYLALSAGRSCLAMASKLWSSLQSSQRATSTCFLPPSQFASWRRHFKTTLWLRFSSCFFGFQTVLGAVMFGAVMIVA